MPVLPRVVGEGEDLRIVLPGEPGFDDAPGLERARGVLTIQS